MSMVRRLMIPVSLCLFLSLWLIPLSPAGGAEQNSKAVIPDLLSGAETSRIIASLYDRIGPHCGSLFVEPNVVLTIAGARGHTEFFVEDPQPGDEDDLKGLNEILEPLGMEIPSACELPNSKMLCVSLENLRGYERVSKLTRIPIFQPYEASSGWSGWRAWHETVWKNSDRRGLSLDDHWNTIAGMTYGYPDRAIRDFNDWLASGRKIEVVFSDVPYAKTYRCAQPNFLYRPEHADDPSIRATLETWGAALRDFYDSPWHRAIAQDPEFLAARKIYDTCYEKRMAEVMRKRAGKEKSGGI
jgi:hypothetical protein